MALGVWSVPTRQPRSRFCCFLTRSCTAKSAWTGTYPPLGCFSFRLGFWRGADTTAALLVLLVFDGIVQGKPTRTGTLLLAWVFFNFVFVFWVFACRVSFAGVPASRRLVVCLRLSCLVCRVLLPARGAGSPPAPRWGWCGAVSPVWPSRLPVQQKEGFSDST